MDFLSKLCSSNALPKVLRLFVFNPGEVFDRDGVALRTKIHSDDATYEMGLLLRAGVLKRRTYYKEAGTFKSVTQKTLKKKKTPGYTLDEKFPYHQSLRSFLLDTTLYTDKELISLIGKIGKIKSIIVSGMFLGEWDRRVDLLVVGDAIDEKKLARVMRDMEAYMGREVHYAWFSTPDFRYRRNLNDRLIRDVFDFPHRVILDRLGEL